jgi:hypothetical protein
VPLKFFLHDIRPTTAGHRSMEPTTDGITLPVEGSGARHVLEYSAGATASVNSWARSSPSWIGFPSLQTVGRISQGVVIVATVVMIARTLTYVVHRRNGLAGPAFSRRLAKFWAVYGAVQFASMNIHAYFDPFGLTWLLHLCQAVILLVILGGGRSLSMCERVFNSVLTPFYEEHTPEVEHQLARARAGLREIDDAARELAKFLLEHMAVGGLSGAVRALMDAAKPPVDASPSGKRRHPALGQPERPAAAVPAPSSRDFHAGEAEARARAISSGTAGFVQASLLGSASDVRPAYDGSRALRAEFRRRRTGTFVSNAGDGSNEGGE